MGKLSTVWSVFIFIPQSTIKYFQQAFGVMTSLSLGVKYLFSPECISIFMLFSNHYQCCKNVLNLNYRTLRDPWDVGQRSMMCKCGGETFPAGSIGPHCQTCRLLFLKAWSSDQQNCHHLGAYYKCRQIPPQPTVFQSVF